MARRWEEKDELVLRIFPFLARIEFHPNVLTVLGVLASLGVGAAFYLDWRIAAGLGLLLAGWCDMVDGIVARLQDRVSLAGSFLDASLDRISDMLLFGGIILGAVARSDLSLAFLALWAATGAVMVSYTRARGEVHVAWLGVGWFDRGVRCWILIFGALSTLLEPALVVIALGASWTALQRLVAGYRQLGELERGAPDSGLAADAEVPSAPSGAAPADERR